MGFLNGSGRRRTTHNPGCLRGGLRLGFRLLRLHQNVQGVLKQDAVTAALAAIDGVFLFGVEGAAGAVPAIVQHLGSIFQSLAAHPLFQSSFQLCGQTAGRRQADPLGLLQLHHLFAVVNLFQDHIHAGDDLIGDKDGIVHPEQFAGFDVQIPILEIRLAEDDAAGSLAFEQDIQCCQVHLRNIFKGQADGTIAADAALEQLDLHKLNRTARGVIVGAGLGNRIKAFLHNTHSFAG